MDTQAYVDYPLYRVSIIFVLTARYVFCSETTKTQEKRLRTLFCVCISPLQVPSSPVGKDDRGVRGPGPDPVNDPRRRPRRDGSVRDDAVLTHRDLLCSWIRAPPQIHA